MVSDGCSSLLIYGGGAEAAQKEFETWLLRSDEPEYPISSQIERIVGAQVIKQLFTEPGHEPVDWPEFSGQAQTAIASMLTDDF